MGIEEDDEEIPTWVAVLILLGMLGVVWVCIMLVGPGLYGGP